MTGPNPGSPIPGRTCSYRPEILEELATHGIRPRATTRPEFVRDYLSHLYRYEIRRLRDRLLAGDIPKPSYAGEVIKLRRRYPLLSVPIRYWLEPAS